MSSTGSPIVDDLVNKFTFKKQRDDISNGISNAVDKVKKTLNPPSDKPIATYTYDKQTTPAKPAAAAPKAAPAKKMPSYKDGTARVPKTGPALLHKDEAVLPKHEAEHYRMAGAHDALGSKEHKPKKEIKHIVTKKAKSGGYIHEHHHTQPEHHPMEEHVSPDQDSMMQHMMQHMGQANPGEADAGQSGSPDGAGAPPVGAMPGGM